MMYLVLLVVGLVAAASAQFFPQELSLELQPPPLQQPLALQPPLQQRKPYWRRLPLGRSQPAPAPPKP